MSLTDRYYAKNEDAASALELKKTLIAYDRTLLVADPRRMEPKKFGGRGARARRQKVSATLDGLVSVKTDISSPTVKRFGFGSMHGVRCLRGSACGRRAGFGMGRPSVLHVYHDIRRLRREERG